MNREERERTKGGWRRPNAKVRIGQVWRLRWSSTQWNDWEIISPNKRKKIAESSRAGPPIGAIMNISDNPQPFNGEKGWERIS